MPAVLCGVRGISAPAHVVCTHRIRYAVDEIRRRGSIWIKNAAGEVQGGVGWGGVGWGGVGWGGVGWGGVGWGGVGT